MTTNERDFLHYKKFASLPKYGEYDIPMLKRFKLNTKKQVEMIGFNYATNKKTDSKYIVHFYLGDYKIEPLWNRPDLYIEMLKRYRAIVAPDFSQYVGMPRAMQIFQHYRNMSLAAYAQSKGLHVIPSASWSDEESFEYCFDGMPTESCICVSTVGCVKNPEVRKRFMTGYEEMLRQLNPRQIIFYGIATPEMLKLFDGDVIQVESDMKRRIKKFEENTLQTE